MLVPLVPTVPVFQPSKIKQPSDMDTTLHTVLPADILQSNKINLRKHTRTYVHVAFHLCFFFLFFYHKKKYMIMQ